LPNTPPKEDERQRQRQHEEEETAAAAAAAEPEDLATLVARYFTRYDSDGDGILSSPAELGAVSKRSF
jgi:hypothetical protein